MFFVLICTTAETFYRFHGLLVVVVNLTDLSGTGRRAAPLRRVSGGREERAWRFSAGHPEHGLHHRVPEEPLHGQQALLRGHGIPPAPPALCLPQGVPGSVQCLTSASSLCTSASKNSLLSAGKLIKSIFFNHPSQGS